MQTYRQVAIPLFFTFFINQLYAQETFLLRLQPQTDISYQLQFILEANTQVFENDEKFDSMQMKFMAYFEDKIEKTDGKEEIKIIQTTKRCVFTLQSGNRYCYYDTERQSNEDDCKALMRNLLGADILKQVGKSSHSVLDRRHKILSTNKEIGFFRAFLCAYDSLPVFPQDTVMLGYLWTMEDLEDNGEGIFIEAKAFYEVGEVREKEIVLNMSTYVKRPDSKQYDVLLREGKIFLDRQTCMTTKFEFVENREELLENGYKSVVKVLIKGFYKKT